MKYNCIVLNTVVLRQVQLHFIKYVCILLNQTQWHWIVNTVV